MSDTDGSRIPEPENVSAIERVIKLVSSGLGSLAALALLLTTFLLAFASIRRYVVDAPLAVTDELVGFLLVSIAFLSVAEGFLRGRQVRLLFLWNVLPRRIRNVLWLLGHIFALVVLALIVTQTWNFAAFSFEIGAKSSVADISEWPWMMIIPLSLIALIAVILLRLVKDTRIVLSGGDITVKGSGNML